MKTLLIVTLILAMVVCAYAANRDFTVYNYSGKTMRSMQLSVHGRADWYNFPLQYDRANATQFEMNFYDNNPACVYDIRVTYTDGTTATYNRGIDLCQWHKVEFDGELVRWN